jgi:hypothetical protein
VGREYFKIKVKNHLESRVPYCPNNDTDWNELIRKANKEKNEIFLEQNTCSYNAILSRSEALEWPFIHISAINVYSD